MEFSRPEDKSGQTFPSDRADFKARRVISNKGAHYIMIKRSVLREDTTILNVCVPNNIPLNYMRQKLIELQREINESIFMVGDFNIYLPEMDRL